MTIKIDSNHIQQKSIQHEHKPVTTINFRQAARDETAKNVIFFQKKASAQTFNV
jgi:hypothetical protein